MAYVGSEQRFVKLRRASSSLVVDLREMNVHEETHATSDSYVRSHWTMNIRPVFMTTGKYTHAASIIVLYQSLTISDIQDIDQEDLGDFQIGV